MKKRKDHTFRVFLFVVIMVWLFTLLGIAIGIWRMNEHY